MEFANLESLAGDRYKLSDEPGWTTREGKRIKGAPQVIPCRHGHVYQHGPHTFGASTNKRGPVATKLAKIGRLYADGDDGVTVLFAPSQWAAIAALILPRRRRRLTDENRVKLVALGTEHRIIAPDCGAGAPQNERQRIGAA